jgi:integrase
VQGNDTAGSRAKKENVGIRRRHARGCATQEGRRCSCEPSYEAVVGLGKTGERRRKTFPTLAQAKKWRTQMLANKAEGRRMTPSSITLRAAASEYVDGMRSGSVTTRGGQRYKASTTRSYEHSLELHALPELGGARVSAITTGAIQDLIERMRKEGQTGSTIANVINPLRAIFRRLVLLGRVHENPTRGVVIPSTRSKRLHAGDPADAARLLEVFPERDRCVWALAFYAGLRLGELRALRLGDVDEKNGVIHVRLSWDPKEGEIEPKSTAGVRDVPILAALRPYLAAQRASCSWSDEPGALFLGASPRGAFGYTGLRKRTAKALAAARLKHVTLHEARHSFASYLAASGIGLKELTSIMGHSSVTVSLDRYGHLFEGAMAGTAAQIDAWFAASDTSRRLAQLDSERVESGQ